MFHHDKTEVSIKESHRHRHDKMKYELKEKHHDGGHIGLVAPPIVPSMGMGTVLPAPLPIAVPSAGHHEKFSLKIKEKVHGRRNSATATTTTIASPAGVVSETIANGPFIAPVAGMPPVENTYVYHDAPQFLAPDMPPVTTTYVVHEPVLPAGLSAPMALPSPAISPIAPIAPMATAMPVTGKHELKIKEKIRGGGAVGATVMPIPEFGAPLVPAPVLGGHHHHHDKFQFKLKETHRA